MSTKPVYLTKEGLKKLEDRLEYLTSTRRSEVAERIKAAIALGDLSENSEYIEAKNDQAFLEGEIVQIETTLRHAQLINSADIDGNHVIVGAVVELKDLDSKKKITYTIVSPNEADPFTGKVSNESPIGIALMEKAVGDTVTISTPKGEKHLKILEVHS
ncbi:MAG: transcription elongation factor GreA [Clostridia bacterium]|nr:transcription elongation factor GreA [Clostridia bacterium]